MIEPTARVTPRFAALFLISRKERYGRELIREINCRMGWGLVEADLANLLAKLEKRKLIKCRVESDGEYATHGAHGARRKYWRTTAKGDMEVEKFLMDIRKLIARR